MQHKQGGLVRETTDPGHECVQSPDVDGISVGGRSIHVGFSGGTIRICTFLSRKEDCNAGRFPFLWASLVLVGLGWPLSLSVCVKSFLIL